MGTVSCLQGLDFGCPSTVDIAVLGFQTCGLTGSWHACVVWVWLPAGFPFRIAGYIIPLLRLIVGQKPYNVGGSCGIPFCLGLSRWRGNVFYQRNGLATMWLGGDRLVLEWNMTGTRPPLRVDPWGFSGRRWHTILLCPTSVFPLVE